jgi:hypothetical protein
LAPDKTTLFSDEATRLTSILSKAVTLVKSPTCFSVWAKAIELINNIPCHQINEVESFYEKKESEFFNEVFDKEFYAKDEDADDEDLQEIDEKYKNYQSKYCGEKRGIISESEDDSYYFGPSTESNQK